MSLQHFFSERICHCSCFVFSAPLCLFIRLQLPSKQCIGIGSNNKRRTGSKEPSLFHCPSGIVSSVGYSYPVSAELEGRYPCSGLQSRGKSRKLHLSRRRCRLRLNSLFWCLAALHKLFTMVKVIMSAYLGKLTKITGTMELLQGYMLLYYISELASNK